MEFWKERPEITATDHPVTVYRALLASYALWYAEQGEDAADVWSKKAADAEGALQDGFGIISPEDDQPLVPNGRARLYMSPAALEYALVGYGCGLLDSQPDSTEIAHIDDLLTSIDASRAKPS